MNLVGGQVKQAFPPVGASQQILVGDAVGDAGLLAGSSATGVAAPASTAATQASANALQKLVHDSFCGVSETYRDSAVTTTGTVKDVASVATTGLASFTLDTSEQGTALLIGQLIGAFPNGSVSTWNVKTDANGLMVAGTAASAEYAIGYVAKPFSTTDTQVVVDIYSTLFGPGVQNKASA
jgi:hypothetical protein